LVCSDEEIEWTQPTITIEQLRIYFPTATGGLLEGKKAVLLSSIATKLTHGKTYIVKALPVQTAPPTTG
jgi:uncharacterized protein YlzI (FlbEa/FlbD family)